MKARKFKSVESYLAAQDAVKARTIKAVIELILTQFPGLELKISWNVPTIHRQGKYVAGICAYKRHLTFSPWSPQIIEDFRPRMQNLFVQKNCVRLPVDWDIDAGLIEDLIRARLAELDSP